jgi:hypothetical protein
MIIARRNDVQAIVLATPLWLILRTDVALIGCGELEGEQRDSQNDEQSEGSVRCLRGGSRLTTVAVAPIVCLVSSEYLVPTLLVRF